jgi:UDP:flavonoid glycosyltransferase YjiC (YdhE family)
VERLLADPGYASGARRLAERIRDLDGLHRGADAVEALVAAGGRRSALASHPREP